ncbi:MAG: cell wall hydrolase [Lachnospiraceae bacterium]
MKKKELVIILLMVVIVNCCFPFTCNAQTQSDNTKETYTDADLRYLTSIIYCEARGEGFAGQKAVGIVVMNRVESELFPNDIESVIYQSGQFSPVSNGSLSSALGLYDSQTAAGEYDDTMLSCVHAAKSVLEGSKMINEKKNVYYLGQYLFFSRYVKNAKFQYGNHMFR